jgi:DNA-binding IclR family transcriptional regulator
VKARVSAKKPTGEPAGPDRSGPALSSSRVQSVDRAVSLLRAVADAGPGGAATVALGAACGLNRATAWRLLSTLETNGLVVSDRSTGRWSLGPGLVDIARSAGSDVVLRDVHEVLESVALQVGETAALAVLRHGSITYVDEVAPTAIVSASWSGRTVSLHATSTGKVVLAWSTDEELARLMPRRLKRYTATTITDPAALRADLDLTRERGYATCHGEYDVSAWGVSAPVLDRTGRLLAVLSIWGPPPRVVPERFPALGAITIEGAGKMAPR